jgi:hypothetical protein
MTYSFASTLTHYINDDWKLVKHLIDFNYLKENDHQGVHAASMFIKSTASCGGLDKISQRHNMVIAIKLT